MDSRALQILASLRADLQGAELGALKVSVRDHYDALVRTQRTSELVSVDLAELLCERLELLLDHTASSSPAHRAAIVGAARYFVSRDDAVPDDASITGLDDDVFVFNAVVREIGRDDLVIDG